MSSPENTHVDAVKKLLEPLFEEADIAVDLQFEMQDGRLYVNAVGDDADFLLDQKQDVTRELSYLATNYLKLSVGQDAPDVRFDVDGTQREREMALQQMAADARAKLERDGGDALIGPFNPYERRLIHIALQDDARITTESLGDGHHKKVRVRWVS